MKGLIAILTAALLASCSGQNATLNACNTYASALFTLSDLRAQGKLSAAAVADINQARAVANPICTQPSPPSDPATFAAVQGVIDKLAAAQAGAH